MMDNLQEINACLICCADMLNAIYAAMEPGEMKTKLRGAAGTLESIQRDFAGDLDSIDVI